MLYFQLFLCENYMLVCQDTWFDWEKHMTYSYFRLLLQEQVQRSRTALDNQRIVFRYLISDGGPWSLRVWCVDETGPHISVMGEHQTQAFKVTFGQL